MCECVYIYGLLLTRSKGSHGENKERKCINFTSKTERISTCWLRDAYSSIWLCVGVLSGFPYSSFTLAYPKFAVVVLHPTIETGSLHTRTHQTPSFILLLSSLSLSLTHSLYSLLIVSFILLPRTGSTFDYNFLCNNSLHHSVSTTIYKVVLLGRHGLMHIVRGARRESS